MTSSAEPGVAPQASAVLDLVRDTADIDPSPGVSALIDGIRAAHGEALLGVIFYGSVLRTGDEKSGLLDFMAVVDRYRPAYGGRLLPAMGNRLLPPNVFYLEARTEAGADVRCKYALVALDQLRKFVGPGTRQVYFWGRLAQPCGVVWARDDASRAAMHDVFATAMRTFATRAATILPESFDGEELWIDGLTRSYGTELRAERRGVAERLVATQPQRFRRMTAALATDLGWNVEDGPEPRYRPGIPPSERRSAAMGWRWRRVQGKALNIARLVKAVFTFSGGVDYALWKIRRHSGVEVEVSERAKRWPLIFGWPTLYRLWRQGALR